MPRTLLLRRAQRLFARALHGGTEPPAVSRRAFLEQALFALSAGALGGCAGRAGSPRAARLDAPRVVVVGAGLAGLCCAYRLRQAGVRARVFEAAARVGGRTLSTRPGAFPDAQVGELGGEFIDTGHLTLRALARELGVALDDRNLASGAGGELWWLAGRAVPEAVIARQFAQAAPLMARDTAAARSDAGALARLDATSLAAWLQQRVAARQPELAALLEIAYRGEFGLEAAEQSSLNLLFSIDADSPGEPRLLGDSDARYHAHRGNQTFARELSLRLAGQIELGCQLVAARGDARAGYQLEFVRAGNPFSASAELLVLALPFSILRALDCAGLPLHAAKRRAIEELGYGTNAKVLGAFARRVWCEDHGRAGVLTDAAFQQLWDSSPGQPGRAGILTNFLGGEQGVKSGGMAAEAWYREVTLAGAEAMFPGLRPAYVADSALRMHWPSHPLSRGSYACYRPGQWAFWGSEGLPEADGTLHFCGEHTSADHQGFMEGAAESGNLVAGAILARLGIEPAPAHAALLRAKRAVPQPAFGERPPLRERRERARSVERALLRAARG